jgi:kynurenine formamidase
MTLEQDGCSVQTISCCNHLGTHLDAPSHFLAEGRTVEALPLSALIGPAVILDLTHCANTGIIEPEDVQRRLPQDHPERIILRTGWSKRFESGGYFEGFPVLSLEAADFFASLRISLLGMDTPSPSPFDDPGHRIHKTLLGAEIIIVEGLCCLEEIPGERFDMVVLPWPIHGASGSPCRAVAQVRDEG